MLGHALGEQLHDRARSAASAGCGDAARLEVGEQVVDRLLGVLLVGPDHARGPALDPADGVLARDLLAARRIVTLPPSLGITPRRSSNGIPSSPTPL